MKRWIVFVLFSILISCPAVSGAAADTSDSGSGLSLGFPLLDILGMDNPDSKASKEKKEKEKKEEEEAIKKKEKEKQVLDKKVDDAIKNAWGGK